MTEHRQGIVRKAHVKKEDREFILEECKKKGIVKSYVIAESKQAIPARDFMLNFLTWEKTPYIAEKLYKKHGIHKRHVKKQYSNIKNHWQPFLKDKAIGEITKHDIKDFMFQLAQTDYSFGVKNDIVRAGTTAFKWAYENALLDKDITTGLVFFSGTYKERQILIPELVQEVFSVE